MKTAGMHCMSYSTVSIILRIDTIGNWVLLILEAKSCASILQLKVNVKKKWDRFVWTFFSKFTFILKINFSSNWLVDDLSPKVMIQYVCAWNRDNKVLNVNKVSRVWVKDKNNIRDSMYFFCNSKIRNRRTNWTTI